MDKYKGYIFKLGNGQLVQCYGKTEKDAWNSYFMRQKNPFLAYCKCFIEKDYFKEFRNKEK